MHRNIEDFIEELHGFLESQIYLHFKQITQCNIIFSDHSQVLIYTYRNNTIYPHNSHSLTASFNNMEWVEHLTSLSLYRWIAIDIGIYRGSLQSNCLCQVFPVFPSGQSAGQRMAVVNYWDIRVSWYNMLVETNSIHQLATPPYCCSCSSLFVFVAIVLLPSLRDFGDPVLGSWLAVLQVIGAIWL